jgi:uncharacterized protein YkwD
MSRLTLVSLALSVALVGCDTPLLGNDDSALINLSPGPHQGGVGSGEPSTPAGVVGYSQETGAATLDEAVALLAEVRATLELPPAAVVSTLTAAAQAHAEYVAANQDYHKANGISPHREVAQLAGFTGAAPADRVDYAGYGGLYIGEVIGYQPKPVGTMQAWLESLYHRLPLIRREAVEVGIGGALGDAIAAHVVEVGTNSEAFSAASSGTYPLVAYPPNGALDVPASWSGLEAPQPTPPPAGYPSGPVLTLSATIGAIAVETAEVRPIGGEPVAVTLLTAQNDEHLQGRDVAVIPHLPLSPGVRYELAITGQWQGKAFAWTSTFTTRPESCALYERGCGAGRACYAHGGELECLWEGVGTAGDECRYLDDCQGGLTCLGSRCRPLCEDAGGANGCDAMCPGESLLASGIDGVSACLGLACTSDSCGAGQGCYWLDGLACGWSGNLGLGADCTYANDCRAGLSCLGSPGQQHKCHALCGGSGMPSCDVVCNTSPFSLSAQLGLKACL